MVAMDVGRICVVKAGRRAGEQVTVAKLMDNKFVMVKTSKGKERKFSVLHLEPTSKKE